MSKTSLPDISVHIPFSEPVKLTDYVTWHLSRAAPTIPVRIKTDARQTAWAACQRISVNVRETAIALMDDINALLPEHLHHIRDKGDGYVWELAHNVHAARSRPKVAGIDVIDPIKGSVTKLKDFVGQLLMDNPPVPKDEWEQAYAERRARLALVTIKNSLASGDAVWANAVRALTPVHWLAISQHGDNELRSLATAAGFSDFSGGGRTLSPDPWDDICCFRGRTTRSIPCNARSLNCPYRDAERERARSRGRDDGMELER